MTPPHIHIPYEKIEYYSDFILKNRLNLEIYFKSSDLDEIERDSIIKLREGLDYNPSLSIHAPFMDLSPGAIDSKIKKATIERFNQVLEIAELLRPKIVVFHSGYEKWKYALKVEPWLEKSIETWKPLNEKAKSLGIKIAIENIFEDEPYNLKLLMEHMDSENFGICFDTGHFNLFTSKPVIEWINALEPYIIELHLHDNNGSADQHLPIGDGNFDFKEFFNVFTNDNCIFTIEAHSPESVLKSMKRLEQLQSNISK